MRPLPPPPGFEALYELRDDTVGLYGFLAVHSTARGPAFGGIRRVAYPDPADARADACALARAMSFKCALAGLLAGGAKTALVARRGADLGACYRAVGRAVESLAGQYVCGPDVGTSDRALDHVRVETAWVNPRENDAGAATARGVLAADRALRAALRDRGRVVRRYAIEGLGAVGLAVATALLDAGYDVGGWDLDEGAMARARARGVRPIDPEAVLEPGWDVLMPCGLGGTIDARRAGALAVAGICGSANNQITGDADAVLHGRGVLHVPDVVSSAGAVIGGVCTVGPNAPTAGARRAAIGAAIDRITTTTADILAASERDAPTRIALDRARSILAGARPGGGPSHSSC